MNSEQIHPRLLARIRKVRKSRKDELLDTQVRVYSRLCKATKRLNETGDPAGPEVTATCAGAAKTIRRMAVTGCLGDQDTLLKIYHDLERVAVAINHRLATRRPPHQARLLSRGNLK